MAALLAALAAVVAVPSSSDADLRARVERAPKDVSSFIERRAGCNHWLGEEPYDEARAAEIRRAIRQLHCGNLQPEERELRRRYSQKAQVLMLLDETTDILDW